MDGSHSQSGQNSQWEKSLPLFGIKTLIHWLFSPYNRHYPD